MANEQQNDTPTAETAAGVAQSRAIGTRGPETPDRIVLPGPSRREFLKTAVAAATAALLSGGAVMARPGLPPPDPRPSFNSRKRKELRAYVFDYSMLDVRRHELFLVAGKQRLRLRRTSRKTLRWLRRRYPVLRLVPDGRLTHWIVARFPADAVQLCYVKRIERKHLNQGKGHSGHGRGAGRPWDWVGQFDHLPTRALRAAAELTRQQIGPDELAPVSSKWQRFGLTAADIASFGDPVGLDTLKTADDTACSMVSKHPELASGDPTSAAYISQNVVGPQSATQNLAQAIDLQGPIEPQKDWSGCGGAIVRNSTGYGTNVPVCNPDTGNQAIDSNGDLQFVPVYSNLTNQEAQGAVTGSLQQVKNDPTLGTNTSIDPTQQTGYIYRYGDGVTTSDQTMDGLGAGSGLSYTTKDYSPGHGYSVGVTDVEASSSSGITADVTVAVTNWYVRYLGLYVLYLDGDGNAIPISSLSDNLLDELATTFPLRGPGGVSGFWDTSDALFLDLLGPEKEILGIPTGDTAKTLKLPMPDEATSLLVLASGMGSTAASANPYNGTTIPGATMTGVFELSLPTFFLALNAAAGLAGLQKGLEETSNVLSIVPLVLQLFADTFEAIGFDDPGAFENIGVSIGETLISSGATELVKFVVTYLTEGETEEDLLDAIPIIGGFLAMIAALGTITQIAETSTQVLQSPSTYKFEVTLTHDIDVVIAGDPNNDDSWPSTATHFKVVLLFDGGTPTQLVQDVPGTTVQSQTASFLAVPLGGRVTVSVQVYSDTGFQVAKASAGPFDNLDPGGPLTLNLQLTQEQVPLTADTLYLHKEVIALNDAGEHVWEATVTPPTQEPAGCTPANGQLCALTGITVNTTAGAVGQSFQSANDAVGDCTSGSPGGQSDQFSNISVTETPQEGYFYSGCGFDAPPRLVYDLVNDADFNFYLDTSTTSTEFQGGVIRQIRLSAGNQGFDAPYSNRAWGRLRFPSDALLLHPGRKIVSINATHSKIEVIDLPPAAVADADAPGSHTYGGRGLREGLMDSPVLAALAPDGTVLVLESGNQRIQAFDLNANPTQKFGIAKADYFFDLKDQAVATYLDFAVEFAGYMYVLWEDVLLNKTLDIYDPEGNYLASTRDFVGSTIAVNYWRDLYAQNHQVLRLPNGDLPARTEPSVSHWVPSTP
jgi:hypothetical protein